MTCVFRDSLADFSSGLTRKKTLARRDQGGEIREERSRAERTGKVTLREKEKKRGKEEREAKGRGNEKLSLSFSLSSTLCVCVCASLQRGERG